MTQPAIEQLSFEEALAQLEEIVRRLEKGGQSLEGSIEEYTRGIALKQHAEKKLTEVKLRVEKIVQSADGKLDKEPFDAE